MSRFLARWPRSILLTAVLLVVASSAAAGAASAAPPPAGCPTDPVTLETLIGLRLERGPLSRTYVVQTNERALECLGSDELTFDAFVAGPEGLGGVVAYDLEPAWLDTWNSVPLYLAAGDREAAPGAPYGPFLPVAVPLDLRPAFDALRGQWVTVSGQFDAPAAKSCVVAGGGAAEAGVVPPPADLVELCRTSLVLTSIQPAPDPCPADDSLEAIIATPEHFRADCFGGRELSFVAVGYSVNNIWLGMKLPPGLGGDWFLGIEGQAESLPVSVPQSVALPDPAGTPWRDRDGVGGGDVRWDASGHFDDARAEACIPVSGDTMDGVPVVLSIGEVRAFCRNRFVVDRLTWLPGAAAAMASPVVEQPPTKIDAPAPADTRPDTTFLLLVILAVAGLVLLVAILVARARGSGTLNGPRP